MTTYLSQHQCGSSSSDGSQGVDGHLRPVVVAYLTSVLNPAAGTSMGVRNSRELRTLAEALDHMIEHFLSS